MTTQTNINKVITNVATGGTITIPLGNTWLLLVFNKGGGSWRSGEDAELLSLSLPSLRLTLRKRYMMNYNEDKGEKRMIVNEMRKGILTWPHSL